MLYWSADAPGQLPLFLPLLIVFIYDRWNQRFHLRSEYEYSYLFDLPFRTHRSPADLLSRCAASSQRAATVGLNTTFREDVRGTSSPPLLQQPPSFVLMVFSGPNPYASHSVSCTCWCGSSLKSKPRLVLYKTVIKAGVSLAARLPGRHSHCALTGGRVGAAGRE